ncbi:MAG: hypothetical protein A2W25_07650 [candidate division Zixibacteria bacterium RBG_16_53_22]|nr:MAG: hypothetical protein A2W25_07650 [candidate division Zixibacteria bacterium RBG_16_53_22]
MKKTFFLLLAGLFMISWFGVEATANQPRKISPPVKTAVPASDIGEDAITGQNTGGDSNPVITTTFLQDNFSDGDYTSNPTWTKISNGDGDGDEEWAIKTDPWIYTYGTVENHGTGFLMGSDSDAGGALADESMRVTFNTDGTGTLRLLYWLHFRPYAWTLEYFDVLIDGNIVQHVVGTNGSTVEGVQIVDLSAYNNGSPHTLTFHYYADYGYVAAFDDVIIINDIIAECPPWGTAEGETDCGPGYVDNYNCGCSNTPNVFQPISIGDTICGESGVWRVPPDSSRDNDWFIFTTPGLRHVHFEATSNFPFLIYFYNPGTGCPGSIIVYSYTTVSGDTLRIEADLAAGTWWARVRPYDYSPSIVCGEARYVAWFYADPPLERDARVVSIDNPQFYRTAIAEVTPVQATVTNFGEDATYDFDVTVDITGSVSGQTYTSTRTATDVSQLENVQLTFDTFTPSCVEDYAITVTCSAINDQMPDNNVLASTFKAIALGYDTYTDGTIYWNLPTTIVSENCVRFRVPAGHTAALNEAAIAFTVSGVPGGLVTPQIYAADGPNGYPGTVLWTGTPFNVTVSDWYYVDLTSTGLTLTSDFYVGYFTVAGTGPGLLADPAIDFVGINFSKYGGIWDDSDDIWVGPPDYHIWLDYDITGGNFTDGQATSIDAPSGTLIGAGPFDVLATVSNAGTFAISGASATATITGPGGVEFTNTVAGISLAVGANTQVDFGDWTPSTGLQYYDVDVALTVPGDQNTCNNTNTASPFILLGDIVLSEDFEADNGGLTEVLFSQRTIWQWGIDAVAGAHSGTHVWGTNLGTNYADSACAALRTGTIAIPAGGGAFAFYAWYRTEDAWDFCNVKISVDGGTNFTLLTPLTGYDMLESGYLCNLMINQEGFSGLHPAWALQAFDLTGYEGQSAIFSIDFGSDTNTNDRGFYVDDMILIAYPVGGCDYIPGDINASGAPNGIDVTYGVAYLKGGSAPRDSCDCSPMPFPFYAAMDVNGTCSTNGIDITYYVAYLKQLQPAILYCDDCPPARTNRFEPTGRSER